MKTRSLLSEKELIQAIKNEAQDRARFELAFKQIAQDPFLKNTAKKLAYEKNIREELWKEILSDVIMILREHVQSGKYRGDGKISSYLIAILTNKMNDLVRSARYKTERQFRPEDRIEAEMPLDIQMEGSINADLEIESLEQDALLARRDQILMGLIAGMSEHCQEMFQMEYWEGLARAVIAEIKNYTNKRYADKALNRCHDQLREGIRNHPGLAQFLKRTR